MNPLHFTMAEIAAWVGQIMWPFMRIGAMLVAAPIFGAQTVNVRVRLLFAFFIAIIVAPLIPQAPAIDPFSPEAVLVGAQQILIGLVIGFVIQMVFSALSQAGDSIALSMGLGFASMNDPQSGVSVPMVSSFYAMMGTLIFLALNGHLVLIELTVQSFHTLPIGTTGIGAPGLWEVVSWGSQMYIGAALVALPVVASMLLINVSKGVISKASPQLNIFAVGFAVMILTGLALILVTLPTITLKFSDLLESGFALIAAITGA